MCLYGMWGYRESYLNKQDPKTNKQNIIIKVFCADHVAMVIVCIINSEYAEMGIAYF